MWHEIAYASAISCYNIKMLTQREICSLSSSNYTFLSFLFMQNGGYARGVLFLSILSKITSDLFDVHRLR